jgi:hypothetical protein
MNSNDIIEAHAYKDGGSIRAYLRNGTSLYLDRRLGSPSHGTLYLENDNDADLSGPHIVSDPDGEIRRAMQEAALVSAAKTAQRIRNLSNGF